MQLSISFPSPHDILIYRHTVKNILLSYTCISAYISYLQAIKQLNYNSEVNNISPMICNSINKWHCGPACGDGISLNWMNLVSSICIAIRTCMHACLTYRHGGSKCRARSCDPDDFMLLIVHYVHYVTL